MKSPPFLINVFAYYLDVAIAPRNFKKIDILFKK